MEILKYTGIYKPINQWFRYSFYDIFDNLNKNLSLNIDSKYISQIQIFGENVIKNLEKLNVFIIGAGALGCELLKYFALMGISTSPDSMLSITDHDIIEKSNLNRQFLFREKDITENKHKAECAISAIKNINENMNCKYFIELVSENTEKYLIQNFGKIKML